MNLDEWMNMTDGLNEWKNGGLGKRGPSGSNPDLLNRTVHSVYHRGVLCPSVAGTSVPLCLVCNPSRGVCTHTPLPRPDAGSKPET